MSRKRRAPKKVKRRLTTKVLRTNPSKQKTLKALNPEHYVIFRNFRDGRVTKYKADRKLVAEVRNRKTKKVVGYLNDFTKATKKKKKAVIFRKFTRTEVSLKTRQEVIQSRVTGSNEFEIRFNEKIIDQVRQQRWLIDKIMQEIDLNDEILFGVEVDFKNGIDLISPLKMYTRKDRNYDFLVTEIAIIAIQIIRGETIRTSPKKEASKKNRKYLEGKNFQYYRKAFLRINFGGFE